MRLGHELLELIKLRRGAARAGRIGAGARTLADALAAEEAGVDAGPRAAERNEGDRDMAVLDRERERAAQLVTVERAMAGTALPARTLSGPSLGLRIVGGGGEAAGSVAREAVAPRPVILAAHGAEKTLEAETLVREPDGAVGIAFARLD